MEKKLRYIALFLFFLMVLIQVIAVIQFKGNQIEDSYTYMTLAKEMASNHSFYPDESNLYDPYIANPGYINYLSVFYRISDSDKLPLYGNIALFMILVYLAFFIADKLFDRKVAYLSIILFSVFPVFVGEILNMRTEILFTVISFAAVAVFLSDIKGKYVIAGVLLALANWVRPLALAFLIVILIIAFIDKVKMKKVLTLILSIIILTFAIGCSGYISSGHFLFQSATGGINLIMGANDFADGSAEWSVFDEGGAGYIENEDEMTYLYKDEFWKKQAIDWIKKNPLSYIKLVPAKLFYMYSVDTYSFSTLYDNEIRTSGREYIQPLIKNAVAFNLNKLTWVDYVVLFNQMIYMIYLLLFIVSIFFLIKMKKIKPLVLLPGILLLGTAMTIITVGGARYHFPYLGILIILSAYVIGEVTKQLKYQ